LRGITRAAQMGAVHWLPALRSVEVSADVRRPSVARGTLGRGRLRSTRFRLASGETVRPVGTHGAYVQLPDFSVSHAAYRGSRAHCGGSNTEGTWMPGIVEHPHLAAGAGEDRAALSGHPRKADAGQYAGVMPQPDPRQTRDAST
jgi:hypothetical protein